MARRVRVNLTMDPALRDAGQRLAEEEHRAFSNYVEALIMKDLKTKGNELPKAPDHRGRRKEGRHE